MQHDTRSVNSNRQDIQSLDEIWLFGYGSLIHKVDFPFIESAPAHMIGWERRFWQASHDHRGTEENPGRVLTLVEATEQPCFGIAYRVTEDVFDHLDHREKNGYLRLIHDLHFIDGQVRPGVVYIGKPDNPAFVGHAPDEAIAAQIFNSEGPSGKNRDYVYLLADALREFKVHDPHIMAIDTLLRRMESEDEKSH